MRKIFIIIAFVAVVILTTFFYFRYQVYYSHGTSKETVSFVIEKGEGNKIIGERLKKEGLISGRYYFYYYVWSHKLISQILPDDYELSGIMTIPEIALTVTKEQDKNIKVTFPEGWTSKQMAGRISAKELAGDEFLKIVNNPGEIKNQYSFLADPEIKTLEGYLFPETYFFTKEMDAETMVKKMLGIFNTKITSQMKSDALKNERTLNDIIIMASIIKGEVRTDEDRKIVSGIFWKRLKEGKALQSCATLAYITGENKKQYSEADTKIQSPYNTYLYKGLPPTPISNPGLSAITAAIYPAETPYNYFLSDPETGETIFSKTYKEHTANKTRYGL